MLSGRSININYVYFIFSLFISAFIGLVSYQFNILCLGKHYELFVQKDIDIINGVANIRAFQQRVIPSLVEKFITVILNKNMNYATIINHKICFILLPVLIFIYAAICTKLNYAISLTISLFFSIINTFVIDSGYWLISFDLYNEIFLITFFILLFSDMIMKYKIISILFMAILWIFIFEEAVYIPIFIALIMNAKKIRGLDFKGILSDPRNYFLGISSIVIMLFVNFLRSAFATVADTPNHTSTILGQWVMIVPNLKTIAKEGLSFLYVGNTLMNGFSWVQSGGIFLLLILFTIFLIKSFDHLSDINFTISLFIIFVFFISFIFAHLEETNTLMPIVALLFILLTNRVAEDRKTRLFANPGSAQSRTSSM